jgi:hypothetical protein
MAAPAFESAYAADPKFRYAEYCLSAAKSCYERLRVQEQQPDDCYRRAQAYEQNGDKEEAKVYYLKYLDTATHGDPRKIMEAQKKLQQFGRELQVLP